MKRAASLQSLACLAVLVFSLALTCGPWPAAMAQSPLTPQEIRGKQIYVQGTSPAGKDIFAYVGEASLELPGNAMACGNCHGLDGEGKPEGGVDPSNLRWEALTKPYGLTHASGRRHPAYTERGLELAITRGLDPAGNKLLLAMPRYEMSKEDLGDLVVYLKRLGTDKDPGISEDKIVIGTAIPASGPLFEMGQAVKAVTTAFFAEVNSQGGVYNRRFELKFTATAETGASTRNNLERFIKDEKIFALTGALIAGAEKEIVRMLAQQQVPLVGPLTLNPQIGFPLNRQVFYLLSGSSEQSRALVNFVASKPESGHQVMAVVYPRNDMNESVLEAIKDQSKKNALVAPQVFDYVAGRFEAAVTVTRLRQTSTTVVFFMGSTADLLSFVSEAEKLSWFPKVFLPGSGIGAGILDAPVGFDGKVFFSFPTSPADQTAEGIKEFRAFANKYKLPSKHIASQISAYSAAKVLVEALKRAGKDLSREKLIQLLEAFYEYPTGLTPPITYGPNRRIGAMGAYVVTIDLKAKQFVPVGGWVNIN
jgi:ABC-type branched-subunit amino acid transport system substrate-binding protein